MFLRATLFACATAMVAVASANADTATSATPRCEEMSFRLYFRDDASSLDATARRVLALATRNVADCDYAELHVRVAGADGLARARGQAILANMDGRAWDVARVEPQTIHRVSAGPEFAQVVMTPRHLPLLERVPDEADVGV